MPTNIEELNAWCDAHGEERFAFDAETDGELSFTAQENGDMLVECALSKRFRKYPFGEAASV